MRRLFAMALFALSACGPPPPDAPPPPAITKMTRPGLSLPNTLPGSAAHLKPDDEVIGVVVGRPRAYAVKGVSSMFAHVVNDHVGGKAVSVAYCDRQDHLRVYTLDGAAAPLALDQYGYERGRGLLLLYNDAVYRQGDGTPLDGEAVLPLADLPFVRTTWKQWLADHPDTDVYTGPELGGRTPRESE